MTNVSETVLQSKKTATKVKKTPITKTSSAPELTPAAQLQALKNRFPALSTSLDSVIEKLPPTSDTYNPFDFPKTTVGIGLQRSVISRDLGSQKVVVFDTQTLNILTDEAVKLKLTEDEMIRQAVWLYCESLIKN